jgi:uncharacterized protein YnzC (UPF0291/DUF896 family)
MDVTPPSPTKLLGVSCGAVLAAKMFGPWAFHFEEENECDYDTYLNVHNAEELSDERLFFIRMRDNYLLEHRASLDHGIAHTKLVDKCGSLEEKLKEYTATIAEQAREILELREQLALRTLSDRLPTEAGAKRQASAGKKGKTNTATEVEIQDRASVPDFIDSVGALENPGDALDMERGGDHQPPTGKHLSKNPEPEDEDPPFTCHATVSPGAPPRPKRTRGSASRLTCNTPMAQPA